MKKAMLITLCFFLSLSMIFPVNGFAVSKVDEYIIERDFLHAFADAARISLNSEDDVKITESGICITRERLDGSIEKKNIVGLEKTDSGLKVLDPTVLLDEIKAQATRSTYTGVAEFENWLGRVLMTVSYSMIYTRYNGVASSYIYRPNGLTASWIPGAYAPDITVSSFIIYYETGGDLVQFPECNTVSDLETVVVQYDVSHVITLSKNDPSSGVTYSAYSSPASNRAFWFANYGLHGSSLTFNIDTSSGKFDPSINFDPGY